MACDSGTEPETPVTETAQVGLEINFLAAPLALATIEATLSGPSLPTVAISFNSLAGTNGRTWLGGPLTIRAGTYSVAIQGRDADGNVTYRGSSSITVDANTSRTFVIVLVCVNNACRPASGTATIFVVMPEPETEPNGTSGAANVLAAYWLFDGQLQMGAMTGQIGTTRDEDYFRLKLGALENGDTIIVQVYAERFGSQLNAVATLYDRSGTQLLETDDVVGHDPVIVFALSNPSTSSTDYVVRVRGFPDTSTGEYTALAYLCKSGRAHNVTCRELWGEPGSLTSLSVVGLGTGSGRVESSPGGIDCAISRGTPANRCGTTFAAGTIVALNATVWTGSSLEWSEAGCTGVRCDVVMDQGRVVTMTFGGRAGDVNGDGAVDMSDLLIVISDWRRTDRPPADINRDGIVDAIDLGILTSNWTGQPLPDLTVSAAVDSIYRRGAANIPVTVSRGAGDLRQGTSVTARLYWSSNATPDDSDILLWESGDFANTTLNSAGSATVTATVNIPDVSPGTYRILAVVDPDNVHLESDETNNVSVYPVSQPAPPQSVAIGDTISGVEIAFPGEVDEYTFAGLAGREVAVFLQGLSGSTALAQYLVLDLLDRAGTVDESQLGQRVRSPGNASTLTGNGRSTRRVILPHTGIYTVRVQGENRDQARGQYRVWIHGIDRAAESVSSAVVIGDTIWGEALDPPGDVDEFTLTGTAGREVAVFLQGLSGSTALAQYIVLDLLDRAGTVDERGLGQRIRSPGNASSLTGNGRSTGRVILPRTGTYTVRVQGENSDEAKGSYRVWVHGIDRAAESLSSAVTVGDTILGEAVGPPGDIDEFTFAGTTGQEVGVFLQGLSGSTALAQYLVLDLLDRAGTVNEAPLGQRVRSPGNATSLTGNGRSTGRVILPRTGIYTVRVQGENNDQAEGPYRILVHGIDRAAERVSSAVTAGDTILGEAVDPPGDMDEFTFAGTAGQEVAVLLQGLSGSTALAQYLVLDLLDQAGTVNETPLGQRARSPGNAGSLEGQSTGTVTLPRSATYTVRIQGENSDQAAGAYRFHIRLLPGGN